jgi:hypothetical protein
LISFWVQFNLYGKQIKMEEMLLEKKGCKIVECLMNLIVVLLGLIIDRYTINLCLNEYFNQNFPNSSNWTD